MAEKKPRVKVPKSASKGEVIEIKALVAHNMDTGRGKDKKGNVIPRMIINKFVCSFNGKEVFSADMHPAVSANPYFAFHSRVEESGTFDFSWTDDKGKTVTASMNITVS